MSIAKRAWGYGLLGVLLIFIDRMTKHVALAWCEQKQAFNEYIACEVVYNRGVSWGLFHSHVSTVFVIVTVSVIFLTIGLLWYAITRFRAGHMILGELLVLAGSFSNIFDRVVYRGVIDFLEFSYRGWCWPSFNGADVCIVIGVFIMIVEYYKR